MCLGFEVTSLKTSLSNNYKDVFASLHVDREMLLLRSGTGFQKFVLSVSQNNVFVH